MLSMIVGQEGGGKESYSSNIYTFLVFGGAR